MAERIESLTHHVPQAVMRVEKSNWKVRLIVSILVGGLAAMFKPLIIHGPLLVERMTFADYTIDVFNFGVIVCALAFLALTLLKYRAEHIPHKKE